MNKYFTITDTLYDICEKFPETIPVFVSNGFSQMDNPQKRAEFGKKINLQMALMLRQQDVKQFSWLLNEAIETHRNPSDLTLAQSSAPESASGPHVVGLLPCPVRIPLLESFNKFCENYKEQHKLTIRHELKAASMGLDWVSQNLDGADQAEQLPDLFISAGFDLFFDKKRMGRFKEAGVFRDTMPISSFNRDFQSVNLRDPAGHYSVISVVPAVFLINTAELGSTPIPRSWEDILKPEFEKRVSLPVGDFDLFNSIMLHIYQRFGDDGVAKLGRSLLESLHPSQMVKSERRQSNRPIVTIMPYFFTKMVKEGGTMQAVWPEDGAIISPIFLLAKSDQQEKLQAVIDYFSSKEVGEILAKQGLFPSVHPEVDNALPPDANWMWLGWDYIYRQDMHRLIEKCTDLFEKNTADKQSLKKAALA